MNPTLFGDDDDDQGDACEHGRRPPTCPFGCHDDELVELGRAGRDDGIERADEHAAELFKTRALEIGRELAGTARDGFTSDEILRRVLDEGYETHEHRVMGGIMRKLVGELGLVKHGLTQSTNPNKHLGHTQIWLGPSFARQKSGRLSDAGAGSSWPCPWCHEPYQNAAGLAQHFGRYCSAALPRRARAARRLAEAVIYDPGCELCTGGDRTIDHDFERHPAECAARLAREIIDDETDPT